MDTNEDGLMNLLFISGYFTLNPKLKELIDDLIIEDETILIRLTNTNTNIAISIEGNYLIF